MIDLTPYQLEIVLDILKKHVPHSEVRVFGSRYKWTSKNYSDLDLAIVGNKKLDKKVIYDLQEAFSDSELPIRVDVLDWYAISDEFKQIIKQGYEVIQEKTKQLPDGWEIKKLGDLCSYSKDALKIDNLSVNNYISTDNMLPNIGGLEIASKLPLSKSAKKYGIGDILISNIRPYFKKIWYATSDGGCSNDVLVFTNIDKDYVYNKFLYYYLSGDLFFDYMMSGVKGTKMPRGDKMHIMNFILNLPPLLVQKQIASILSRLDEKIDINNQINKKLDEIAQTLFARWFVDFNFPDENSTPYKDSGGVMIDSELGKIPKGWRVGKLSDVIDFFNGYAFKSDDLRNCFTDNAFHVFKMWHIKIGGGLNRRGTKSYIAKNKCSKQEKFILKVGDICMCMTDMKGSVTLLGHTSLIDENDKYIFNQRVGLLRIKNANILNYPFVYILTNHHRFLETLRGKANSGVQVNLSSEVIKNSPIAIPNHEVHYKFDTIAVPIYQQIFNNQCEIEYLENIRDSLLPKLMSGEIDVSFCHSRVGGNPEK